MSTITTRAGKGSPLTNAEVDANFTNLNADKLESVSQSDVTQHQAALSITESQISDLDKYTQAEVDALLASLEAYDQSLNTTDDVAFNSVQLTGGTGDQGTVSWNTDEETLDVILNGATLQVGQEIHYHVRNNTGSTIPDGTAVYATGTLGASGRITVAPYTANGTIPAKYFLGITTEDIADGTDGKATHFGKIRHIDTSAFTDGDVLYPSATTAGALTATAPTGSNVALPVAIVIHATSNGTLFVRATTLDENAYATTAQGALADSALQSGDNVSELTNDAGYATTSYVDTAESDAVSTANAYTDTRETAITTAYQTYVDTAESDAISTAAADATSKANTAEANANAYTDTKVANLVASAPATLDTLNELAAALGDDPNFATTVSTQIGTKLDASHDMTLTLAGDATGSATFTNMGNATLTVAVADDSHNHTIANVDGLQAALDGKVDDSQVLTNVPAGAVFTDTVYTHPSYAGDDFSIDTGALTGATVISDIDINVTTDTQGHVTDANASVATRNLTLANLGFTGDSNANYFTYSHPSTHAASMITTVDEFANSNSTNVQDVLDDLDAAISGKQAAGTYNTIIGTDADINTSGATIIDNLYMTDGVITSHGTRTLSYSDIGAAASSHTHSYLPLSGGTLTGTLNGTNVDLSGYIKLGNEVTLQESTDRADLLQITSTTSGWAGLQIRNSSNEGRWSFMTDGSTSGFYDDENNDWALQMDENSELRLYHNGNEKFNTTSSGVYVTGSLTASGDVTAYSDARLKENVEVIPNALDKVKYLSGYTYDRTDLGIRQTGVIAQEVLEVLPEAVSQIETEDDYYGVNYGSIVGLLIEAIKELEEKVAKLEAK